MKKIIAVLAMVLLVMPFASVLAITGNYYVYSVGDEVNFYIHEEDKDGLTSYILSDEGASSQYVKTLLVGGAAGSNGPYAEAMDIDNGALTDFTKSFAYTTLSSILESNPETLGLPYAKPIEEPGNLSLITLDELKTVFGATLDGDRYLIDASKWASVFEDIKGSRSSGMYTQTVEGTDVWVVKWAKNAEGKITDIFVEKEPVTDAKTWALVPVVYMDKTYDCTKKDMGKEYACYSCGEDYTWTEVGKQANTCTLVEKIKAKADCVKGPKTGVEDYILPFIAILAVGGVALTIVSKKDLFRGI